MNNIENTNNKNKMKITVTDLAVIGLMAAVVFISNFFRIPIMTPLGKSGLHFGNIFCLLSGLMLGNLRGGFSAGLGSMLFDFTDPIFISSSPWTFMFKFAMAYTAGTIAYSDGANGEKVRRNIVAAICGSFLYTFLYVGKNFIFDLYFLRNPIETVIVAETQRAIISLMNGVMAVVVSIAFAPVFRNAMKRSGIYSKLYPVSH